MYLLKPCGAVDYDADGARCFIREVIEHLVTYHHGPRTNQEVLRALKQLRDERGHLLFNSFNIFEALPSTQRVITSCVDYPKGARAWAAAYAPARLLICGWVAPNGQLVIAGAYVWEAYKAKSLERKLTERLKSETAA